MIVTRLSDRMAVVHTREKKSKEKHEKDEAVISKTRRLTKFVKKNPKKMNRRDISFVKSRSVDDWC